MQEFLFKKNKDTQGVLYTFMLYWYNLHLTIDQGRSLKRGTLLLFQFKMGKMRHWSVKQLSQGSSCDY